MPRLPPFDRPATYDDLVQLPDHLVGEILDGELHGNPRPSRRAASSVAALGGTLLRGLDRSGGPDSWQVLPDPELRLGEDILFPALAGWRLSRLPALPATPYFSVPPDWVCEVLASATASFRARKLAIYAREGVSHAWLIDPVARTLDVRRLESGRWTVVATYLGGQRVRTEPFDALELELTAL